MRSNVFSETHIRIVLVFFINTFFLYMYTFPLLFACLRLFSLNYVDRGKSYTRNLNIANDVERFHIKITIRQPNGVEIFETNQNDYE